MKSFVFFFLLTATVFSQAAELTGYMIDKQCISLCEDAAPTAPCAPDGINVFYSPEQHTGWCKLLSMCVASGYVLMGEDVDSEGRHAVIMEFAGEESQATTVAYIESQTVGPFPKVTVQYDESIAEMSQDGIPLAYNVTIMDPWEAIDAYTGAPTHQVLCEDSSKANVEANNLCFRSDVMVSLRQDTFVIESNGCPDHANMQGSTGTVSNPQGDFVTAGKNETKGASGCNACCSATCGSCCAACDAKCGSGSATGCGACSATGCGAGCGACSAAGCGACSATKCDAGCGACSAGCGAATSGAASANRLLVCDAGCSASCSANSTGCCAAGGCDGGCSASCGANSTKCCAAECGASCCGAKCDGASCCGDGSKNHTESHGTYDPMYQHYTMEIPQEPGSPGEPTYLADDDVVGIMSNGVLLDSHQPTWSYDSCNGHSDKKHQYHYHLPPKCFLESVGVDFAETADWWKDGDQVREYADMANQFPATGPASPVIGFARDGFPIFGMYDDQGMLVRSADLDECNGRTDSLGNYGYYMTVDPPFAPQCLRGEVGAFSYYMTSKACPKGGITNAILDGPAIAACEMVPFADLANCDPVVNPDPAPSNAMRLVAGLAIALGPFVAGL